MKLKMGGGHESNSNCIPIYKDCSCLLCGQKTHKVAQCPWMHVICKNCNSECDLLEDNNKKRFIKCQKCESAQWLDDLMGNSSDKPNDLGCKKEKSEPKKLVFEKEAKESSSSKSNSNLKLNIELVIEDLSEAFNAKILLKGKEQMKQI
ncbi:hypothetical protein IFM89_022609 [Coptis chinensis]|uniref:Uncharacterized protein n=1 Tax=Coptis chinensis TaxID=261450 RepID=A0A835IF73_9MAGN|nr:hypothetical protein IFM89_022609 [Coptis chinensis]